MSNFTDITQASIWNTFTIVVNGTAQTIPGLASVNVNVSRSLNKQKATDQDGEIVTDKGGTAASITVDVLMNGYQYEMFCKTILPALQVKSIKGKQRDPIICDHPQLTACGIQKILLDNISFPAPKEGLVTISLKFAEYTKPKPQKKKVDPNVGRVFNEPAKLAVTTLADSAEKTYGKSRDQDIQNTKDLNDQAFVQESRGDNVPWTDYVWNNIMGKPTTIR